MKPLGRKAYGSIGHLPQSRMGPGDHAVPQGQADICCKQARKGDMIVVQEKLDGSCVAVARIDDVLHPLGRAGWPAASSPYLQHRLFHNWVMENADRFLSVLDNGERIVGEWLAQAHGTQYHLIHEPFVAFDIMQGAERLGWYPFSMRILNIFAGPQLLHYGPTALPIEEALHRLGHYGFHGAVDQCEGVVYRVETDDKVNFLAKYVRPDKVDGKYLPEVSGKGPVWNWKPRRTE